MAKLYEFPSEGVKKEVPMYEESNASPFAVAIKILFQRDDLKPLTFTEGADGKSMIGRIIIPAAGVIPEEDKVIYLRYSDDKKNITWKELH